MTSKHDMTMTELVELATLDAYGLLPPADSVKFERAFMAAPAEVQSEIRRIQTDFATNETFLGDEVPPDALRGRILTAISQAIESEAEHLAPLATIGDKAGSATAEDTYANSYSPTRPMTSDWTWRMAALILLGVAVALAIFGSDVYRQSKGLAAYVTGQVTYDELGNLAGPQLTEFLDNPNCRIFKLDSVEGNGHIRLAVNENTGEAFILGMDLGPEVEASQLRIVSTDGTSQTIAVLDPNASSLGQSIESIDMNLFAATKYGHLEVVDKSGKVLLRST